MLFRNDLRLPRNPCSRSGACQTTFRQRMRRASGIGQIGLSARFSVAATPSGKTSGGGSP